MSHTGLETETNTTGAPPEPEAVSPWLLMGSAVASRVGLWMFDIAALQIIQETVPEQERGQVGGMQAALQEVLQILSFATCILADSPQQFYIPVLLSFLATSISCGLFLAFFCQEEDLFH